jgi:predicted Ser/Thr protein kinase
VQALGPGDEIGGYLIEAVAGRGGMGLVYRARQRRPDRIVAIKVIAPELAADPSFRARFEQESNIAAQIEHPNVIPVYAAGEDQGRLFIAMRYVQGVDLGALLARGGALAPERAARLVAQAADALDAAHARGLVHRDVKPGNILVDGSDHVYLTDFGLTKRSADTRGMTATGMFVGTVDYIAPEQVEGRRIDGRADIYALGCVLYELLSGTVPFPRDSDVAKIFAHVNDSPAPLTGIPPELAAAVARAMAKRPEDRFASAGDFGRAAVAGAEGRVEQGAARTVATGAAAPAQAVGPAGSGDPTEVGAMGVTELAATGAGAMGVTELSPTPNQPARPGGGGSGPTGSRRGLLAGGGVLAVVVVAVIVVVLVAGGAKNAAGTTSSPTSTTSTTPIVSTTSSTSSTATTSSTSTTTTPVVTQAPTATRLFSVESPSGGLTVGIQQRASGSCFTGSIDLERPDAWRCTVGNTIYDPCFSLDQSHVVCPPDGPWGRTAVLVNLTAALPASGNTGAEAKGTPWAIQLANGARCLLLSGASNVIAGQRLNYGCTRGLGLYGDVNRSAPVWTIFGAGQHASSITPYAVAIVWY